MMDPSAAPIMIKLRGAKGHRPRAVDTLLAVVFWHMRLRDYSPE